MPNPVVVPQISQNLIITKESIVVNNSIINNNNNNNNNNNSNNNNNAVLSKSVDVLPTITSPNNTYDVSTNDNDGLILPFSLESTSDTVVTNFSL